jgi:hypothetical protein
MKVILAFIVYSTILFAQDESILKLFPGKWKMDIANTEIYEEWIIENDNELIGKSYTVDEGKEMINETLYLKKFGDQWAYIAIPSEQSITLFALVEHLPKKFIFENKEHDFPQRIIYEFHKGGKLTSAIEGNVNGEIKRREFNFIIVAE